MSNINALISVIVVYFVCVSPLYAIASEADSAITQAQSQHLAKSRGWLKLLHYYKSGDSWESLATDESFFISRDGRKNPHQELTIAIHTLQEKKDLQCIFPARTEWLYRQLNIKLSLAHCKSLTDWLEVVSGEKLKMFFADGNLNEPASMFGHTFLATENPSSSSMIRTTLSYVADSQGSNAGIKYIANGVFGKYDAIFSIGEFHELLKKYTELEGRNLWEYELALEKHEVYRVLLHIWETKSQTFNYYFFNKNCSYQTLATIDVASDRLELIDHSKVSTFYTLPINTLTSLENSGLLIPVKVWPSKVRQINTKLSSLSRQNIQHVYNLTEPASLTVNAYLSGIPSADQLVVLEAAFQALSLKIATDDVDRPQGKTRLHELINARLQRYELPRSTEKSEPHEPYRNPIYSHKPRRIDITTGSFDSKSYQQVTFQAGYHEPLDLPFGFNNINTLAALEFSLRKYTHTGVQLEELNLLEIVSRSGASNPLSHETWSFRLGKYRKPSTEYKPVNSVGLRKGWIYNTPAGVFSISPGISIDQGGGLQNNIGVEGAIRIELLTQIHRMNILSYYESASYLRDAEGRGETLSSSMSYSHNSTYKLIFALSQTDDTISKRNEFSLSFRYFY